MKFAVVLFYLFSNIYYLFYIIMLPINFTDFKNYWRNCPYLISDLEYNLHIKRRCELYNVNSNNRYSFEYICSYDSSKDFIKNLEYPDIYYNIDCVPFKNDIENNDIINTFVNEYKNEEKFLCSREDIPNYFWFAKSKDCNEKKYKYFHIFLILFSIKILFIIWPCFYPLLKVNNINVFYYLIRGANFIHFDINNESTKVSDTSNALNRFENFLNQKTKNIIIENKKEYSINVDIKNIGSNSKIYNIETNNQEKEKELTIDLNTINSINSKTNL